FLTFLSLLANSIAQAIAPRLGQAVASGEAHELRRSLARLRLASVLVTAAAVTVALFLGRQIVLLAYGEAFAAVAPPLPWVMLAGGFGFATTFSAYGLIALRRVRELQWTLVAAALVCATLCWLLVARHGLAGAIAAWNLGLFTQFVLSELFLARSHRGRPL